MGGFGMGLGGEEEEGQRKAPHPPRRGSAPTPTRGRGGACRGGGDEVGHVGFGRPG